MTLRAESYTIKAGAMFNASSYVQVNQMFKLTMSSALLIEDYTTVRERCATQMASRSGKSFQIIYFQTNTINKWVRTLHYMMFACFVSHFRIFQLGNRCVCWLSDRNHYDIWVWFIDFKMLIFV